MKKQLPRANFLREQNKRTVFLQLFSSTSFAYQIPGQSLELLVDLVRRTVRFWSCYSKTCWRNL